MAEYKLKWNLEGIAVHLTIDQDNVFHSDEAKIRVILNNLFSNAFKFQKEEPGKWIKININVNNKRALVEISDNGIGIEEKHLGDVFNLFHRATQRNVGSGLGLYMVKESIEQLNGSVVLNSIVGKGTEILVHLPDLKL
jgi:signal transduction histidine kinase